MYRDDPITSSSPPRAPSPADDYATQPTQILDTHSPFFPVPSVSTQATLPLTPQANRVYQLASSQLQVPRSSPTTERFSSPPMSQTNFDSQTQTPYAYSGMAPPGTSFLPPQPVRKPVINLTSDDPPAERDPFEEDSDYRSNISFSKVDRTSRVEETPQKPIPDFSSFSYTNYNASNNQRKRPSAGLNAGSPPKKQKQALRQNGPSRAIPIDLTEDDSELTLVDIADPDLRKKTHRLQAIFPNRSVQRLFDALKMKRGHFDDACDLLASETSDDELLRSPQLGVAQTTTDSVAKTTTAQRTLKGPVTSILDRYTKLPPAHTIPTVIASPEQEPPRKRKLKRGRRNPSPSSPETTPQRPRAEVPSRPKVIDLDDNDDDVDEGIVEISDDDSEAGGSVVEDTQAESGMLDFFNDCSVEAMLDLSGHKEDDIREILDQRPFESLDAIKALHVDAQQAQEKSKKKARKPRVTFGTRLVESAEEMWGAYSAIDSVVKQCETLGKPMVAGMARWGINIFGASTEDGVDATSLDDSSDASSSRDSGYHTPRSDVGTGDIRRFNRTKLLKQPTIMNEGIELKDYQVVGLNWLNLLWQNKISGILADDMGLGKTCQVIAFLSHLKEQGTSDGGPTLIIVPGSTLENWCREFQRFSETINFTPYYGGQTQRFEHQDTIMHNISQGVCDVIITTYDLTFRKEDNAFLRKCRPKICIFDEGHVLKNANTIRYKSLMRIDTQCRILLTGTPLQNSLQELMSILGFLMPEVFYGRDSPVPDMLQVLFKHKAKVTETDSHSTLLSAQRIQRARTMLTPFILRRKKAQVLKHLPKKTSRVEYCELSDTQKELYQKQLEKQRKILQDRAAGIVVKDHANVMMKLRQAAIHPLLFRHRYPDDKIRKMAKACLREDTFAESNPDIIFEELQLYQDYQCHHLATKYPSALKKFQLQNQEWLDSGKVTALLNLLKQYKANGDRALVFSQFTSVMDILSWVFDTHDIAFMRMDGSTPITERQSLMDDFHADTSISVFMISTKSGGAGINLACANKVVIFDSSFNPQDDIQAENRAHRVGQTREVEVVRLVSRGTVEEQIYALGVSKLELDKMVQGDEGGDGDGDSAAGAGGKSKSKSKKKAEDAGGAGGLSKAEEAGIEAVENMLLAQLEGGGKGDVKDQFIAGLKKAGVKISK
ncbi:SNF2 family N-terminal domain-containing protein [Phaeosphaeriaceae sp. PMI808]|nr:SNF2 family N-terminal domain-containing protein [Phaeosphaeriaceae sp. PMI808]